MKIGMITRTVPPFDRGGIQTHVAELSKALVEEGVDVHLFIVGKKMELHGAKIHPVKARDFPGITLGLYMTYTLNCARKIAKYDLDVIHGHSMYSFGYSLKRNRIPYVATIHGTQLNELRHGIRSNFNFNHVITDTFTTFMEMYTTRRADKLIAVSLENKKDIVMQYDIPPEKIEVIPNGITPERFTPSNCESKTVLYVGRLHERKRVDKLVDAFAQVKKEVSDAKLKIVGSGNMEEKLKQQIKRLNLEKSVKLTGFVPENELPKNYTSGSIFVLPSAYEGFGIVLIEAMASGLPVVSVKTGGAVEVVKDDWNGYLVEYETMSETIIKLLNDEKLRKKMGARGRKFVEDNYSWRKIAKDIIKVYVSVM